jgi:hypothetical protein
MVLAVSLIEFRVFVAGMLFQELREVLVRPVAA